MANQGPSAPPGEVSLRDVTKSDIQVFFENQLDPDAANMAAFPARDRDAHTAHWTKIMDDQTVVTKTILFEGEVAGNIVSWLQGGKWLVGYWIGKSYWGKGVATKALAEFLGHVQERPLFAHVAKHNVGSIRVLEKCGFTISGEHEGVPNGDGNPVEEFLLELRA